MRVVTRKNCKYGQFAAMRVARPCMVRDDSANACLPTGCFFVNLLQYSIRELRAVDRLGPGPRRRGRGHAAA